jgi:hypothetical protein
MRARSRALVVWGGIAAVGVAFTVGPFFTHRDLTAPHIAAHAVTGPLVAALALWQAARAVQGRARRAPDVLLAVLGLWLALLPFVLPAPGLHVPAHVASGLLVAAGAVWNAVRPPGERRPPQEKP